MKQSHEFTKFCLVFLMGMLIFSLSGCGGDSSGAPPTPAPLSADNINLIFVVSPDLAYNAPGDINPSTANLTNQGLQRSLLMATYLKQQVLGTKNVTGIYALEPMTHLQTANNYPDMAAIGYIQQFALLNQITLTGAGGAGSPLLTANSYPLNASYASGAVPSGVAPPLLPALLLVARGWISTTRRQQRSPGSRYRQGKRPGLLCLLGALGDHQRPDGKYQQAQWVIT